MASARQNVLRNCGLLLAFLCLLLMILFYTGWNQIQRSSPDAKIDFSNDRRPAFSGTQTVERLGTVERGGEGGGGDDGDGDGVGGVGGGGRAGKPQFQFINRVGTSFDTEAAAAILELVKRKAPARDPQLIGVVRHLLDPPPTEGSVTLANIGPIETPQSKEVDVLLNQQTRGFFIECGALDGERASNSMFFEIRREWTGVLIEANPYYYTQLLGKNRNIWTLNACLSPYDYATELEFESSKGHTGQVVLNDKDPPSDDKKRGRKKTDVVPCFPLETILLALNQTHVDYFSLDVEGLELPVLKTIPFDRFDIRVLTVEYRHGGGGKDEYKSFMESKGYRTHKDLTYFEPRAGLFAEDYVFVKQ